jgi:hypothetical protein
MTATENYQATRLKIDEKIARMQDLIKHMDERQAADPKNWAFSGSAAVVSKQLQELIGFLSHNE